MAVCAPCLAASLQVTRQQLSPVLKRCCCRRWCPALTLTAMLLESTALADLSRCADALTLALHPAGTGTWSQASKLAVPEGFARLGIQLARYCIHFDSPEFSLCLVEQPKPRAWASHCGALQCDTRPKPTACRYVHDAVDSSPARRELSHAARLSRCCTATMTLFSCIGVAYTQWSSEQQHEVRYAVLRTGR